MRKLIQEDVSFVITVVDGKMNDEGILDCRNGHEIGDRYICEYGCPADFCQKCMLKAFPIMEAVRAGGDLRNLGGESESKIRFCCPDGVVIFQLEAKGTKKSEKEKYKKQSITIRALTPALCKDWLEFFDNAFCDHEDWATCYCLEGHLSTEGNDKLSDPKERREKAIALIQSGEMRGYLAYENGEVVGWCNTNDRENYEYLSEIFSKIGYTDKEANLKIKSIFCFLIAPKSRGKGIATQLLKRVCEDAEKDGYSVVEAYPFADETYAFQYHGTVQMYEKSGFCEIADLKYVKVMQKKLG